MRGREVYVSRLTACMESERLKVCNKPMRLDGAFR